MGRKCRVKDDSGMWWTGFDVESNGLGTSAVTDCWRSLILGLVAVQDFPIPF